MTSSRSPALMTSLSSPRSLLRRLGTLPFFSHYNRLIMLVALLNLIALGCGVSTGAWVQIDHHALGSLSNLILANLSVAILVRQQYVINFLFWIVTRAPTRWPLSVRWTLAKVYHFGGLHSGCAVAATLWFVVFLGAQAYNAVYRFQERSVPLLVISAMILALLLLLVVMAQPAIRGRFHNGFERVHRFGGWSALLLFWAQTILFIGAGQRDNTLGKALMTSAGFWMLLVLTISILLPWLRLRRVSISALRPSPHAVIIRFNHGVTPFPGSATAISRNPLWEWHSFANIPMPGEDGFRLIISRAGDWTGKFIDDMPTHVWVKGITTAGVANIETLFAAVVYVATGSGIGPVLPHLLAKRVPLKLIWSARNPRKTYGDALVDEILAAQPDALIWDTDERGKPDLVQLAHALCQSSGAEAVICIANQKLTTHVVTSMERMGIPAYGAIWDS